MQRKRWAPLKAPDNRLYLGTGGSGKTTLARSHLEPFARVLICDPTGQDDLARGARIISDPRVLVAELERREREPFRICWRMEQLGAEQGFSFANRAAWCFGAMAVLWDEADLFMGAHRLEPSAYQLWNMGRHRGLRVFATSRRPASVSRDCTANIAYAAVFRMTDPADLKWLRAFMDTETAQRAATLDFAAHERIDWSMKGATVTRP